MPPPSTEYRQVSAFVRITGQRSGILGARVGKAGGNAFYIPEHVTTGLELKPRPRSIPANDENYHL